MDGKGGIDTDDTHDDRLPLVQPASAGRRGALPVLLGARSEAEEAELLAERIAALLAEGAAPDDIAVLARAKWQLREIERVLTQRGLPLQSMQQQAFRRFDWQQPSIKLLTLHSAKGLEFAHVFVAGLQALPMGGESVDDAARLLYVAMTRATRSLVLSAVQSASGGSALVRRVRTALDDVARQFAARADGTE
jgi:superfamily I DNA/RNA helicase